MEFRSDVVGSWTGGYDLWFEPGDLRSSSESTLRAAIAESSEAVALRYSWEFDGTKHTGAYLMAASGAVAFTDTFHTSGSVMPCRPTGELSFVGTYEAEGTQWEWRTSFEMPSADELVISAWNVSPNGDESQATLARYWR